MTQPAPGYRPCVGITVINRDGLVWVGRRADAPGDAEGSGAWWQMPQGGIDGAEDPADAALRELIEETGMRTVTILGNPDQSASAERLTGYSGPMYALFETEFGVRMIRADEKVRAVAAAEDEARMLEVAPGAPLLSVERLSFTYGDQPVELRRGLYETSHHHYRNALG